MFPAKDKYLIENTSHSCKGKYSGVLQTTDGSGTKYT